jgi:hypothetical protein
MSDATVSASPVERARMVPVADDLDAINRHYRAQRWSDGLPVVPPTVERVERMLAHAQRPRDEVIARLAPTFGAATVELIAINAVLAGCEPPLMPVLIAAIDAMAAPEFNLQAIQTTTNPVAVWLVLNGPIVQALEFNAGGNCLGEGNGSNATLGRAVRLLMRNVGGALPGDMDASTQGQPGRYSFCCAENEARSPWAPFHVERGFAASESTVTVVAAEGSINMNTHTKDADDLLRAIAGTMLHSPSNEYHHGGEPWLVLGPEHADVLQRGGYTRAAVQAKLWDLARMPASQLTARDYERTRNIRRAELGEIGPDTRLPIAPKPSDICIIVAGGTGTHSVYIPSFGLSLATTRAIPAHNGVVTPTPGDDA